MDIKIRKMIVVGFIITILIPSKILAKESLNENIVTDYTEILTKNISQNTIENYEELISLIEKKENLWKLSFAINNRSFKNLKVKNFSIGNASQGSFIDGKLTQDGDSDFYDVEIKDAVNQKYGDNKYAFSTVLNNGAGTNFDQIKNHYSTGFALERQIYRKENWQIALRLEFNYSKQDTKFSDYLNAENYRFFGYEFSSDLLDNRPNFNIAINEMEFLKKFYSNQHTLLKYNFKLSMYSLLLGPTISYQLNDNFCFDSGFGVGLNWLQQKTDIKAQSFVGDNVISNQHFKDTSTTFLPSIYFYVGLTYNINKDWSITGAYRYEKFLKKFENEYFEMDFDQNVLGIYLNYSF